MIIDSQSESKLDRRVPSLPTVRVYRSYLSAKNGLRFQCRTPNELHALYYSEVSPEVVGYRVRPYTPDLIWRIGLYEDSPFLEERLSDGRTVITRLAESYDEVDSCRAAETVREYYEERGIAFQVRKPFEIESNPTFDAVQAIQAFRLTPISFADVQRVRSALCGREAAPLAEVRDLFKTPALGFAKLSAMMVHRFIVIDVTQVLDPATSVRLLRHN